MSDCIFCKIAARSIPANILYENDDVLVFLDAFPTTTGHSLAIPKKHFDRFDATPHEMIAKVMNVIRDIAPRIGSALSAQGFNIGLNNGAAAGQVIGHVHWHIIPRYDHDGLKAWGPKSGGAEELPDVAQQIAQELAKGK